MKSRNEVVDGLILTCKAATHLFLLYEGVAVGEAATLEGRRAIFQIDAGRTNG